VVTWHIETDFVAIAIFMLLIFKTFILNKEKAFTDRVFVLTLILGIVGTIIDIVSSSVMNYPKDWWTYELCMVGYLLFMPLLTLVWVIYTASLVEPDEAKAKRLIWIFVVPYAIYALISLTNPIHERMFVLTPEMVYSRGPLFIVLGIGSQMFYAALGTLLVLLRWKKLAHRSTGIMLIILYISTTSTYWIQIANPGWLITCSAYAVAFLVCDATFETQRREKLFRSLNESREQLKELADEATRANNVKTDFLANMSHEIRTPLNAVIGMTEMIIREAQKKEIQEYAVKIQQAGNHLLSIINDILDISKIESGKMEFQESKYELGSLINDSYNMVATRSREKGLTINVTCDPTLPRLLYGDEYHLRQILVNLLSNAVKYTDEGGVELLIDGEEDNNILRLEADIKDTGIGIKPENIPRLFNKFDRFGLDKNRHVEGTGLGLSITKQLVDLMHGEITVESVYGVGTVFTVRIPQKIADRTPIGDINATYLDIHRDIEQYKQSFEAPDACILVVDDIPVNLQVIRKLLQMTRIEVDTAASGAESLKKVCERRYDLILMDHMMPGMDGVETMEAMQKLEASLNRDVPAIMLTANAMQGAREEYLAMGFVDYLAKPVRGARLESVILKYLPKEKVHLYTDNTTQTAKAEGFCERLAEALPELDINTGISYCADDEEFFRSILKEFTESSRGSNLEQAYQSGDWNAYKIEVHSLKNDTKMVGLSELSEECIDLEQSVKQGDMEHIPEKHRKVIEHYRRAVEKLKQIFRE